MADSLADDVRELLENKKGDERILRQILRACENDEVISNYERSYVRKLAEKHLVREPDIEGSGTVRKPAAPGKTVPQASTGTTAEAVVEPGAASRLASNNRKMVAAIAGVALVIAVVVAVSMYAQPEGPVVPVGPPVVQPDALSIQTDLESYQKGDLISISGSSPVSGFVSLSITNQDSQLAWNDRVTVKGDGVYSTLAIAGGSGWEESGTFTITAENSSESTSSTFTFTG